MASVLRKSPYFFKNGKLDIIKEDMEHGISFRK